MMQLDRDGRIRFRKRIITPGNNPIRLQFMPLATVMTGRQAHLLLVVVIPHANARVLFFISDYFIA
jgi:hypothetical protein